MSTKYLKKIKGEASSNIAHRVDNKPVFNKVSTTSEYRINGDWYDATGTKLPPQSYLENPDGTLVEFEVQDGKVADKHSGGNVPSIVENKARYKEVEANTLLLNELETVDPLIAGTVWNNAGILTLSSGV